MRKFSLLLALAACLAWPGEQALAQSREEREVRALLDRAFQAANGTDPKLAQQNLADHSSTGGPFFPAFGPNLSSTAEVENLITQSLGQLASRTYEATGSIDVRADKNVAWATYPWRAALVFKDGTRNSVEGRATATFVREGKYWKFAHWHSSVGAPPPLTATTREAETRKILEVERGAWEAIKAKKPEAVAGYFAADASMYHEGSAYRVSGKSDLLREVTSSVNRSELNSYQMLDPQVQVFADTALLTYYFTEAGVAGGKEFSTAGKITVVLVKQGGVWRAVHEHRSVNR